MKYVITIDTEADNQWQSVPCNTTENLAHLPRFQALCDRFGFKPTYLCTYEVIQSKFFSQTLGVYAKENRAEIGAHLHPWSTPPFEARLCRKTSGRTGVSPVVGRNGRSETAIGYFPTEASALGKPALAQEMGKPYPSELPLDLFAQKLACLTHAITHKTGVAPVSYRAGRWGYRHEHTEILQSLGYLVECSVTPLVSWQGHVGQTEVGPDFRHAPARPYRLDFEDMNRSGDSRLLEVPMTILNLGLLARLGFSDALLGKINRFTMSRRLCKYASLSTGPRWYRPFPEMNGPKLNQVYRQAQRLGMPVVEMMLHSSELMAGGSPFRPTPASIEQLYCSLEHAFSYAKQRGAQGSTLAQLAQGLTSTQYVCNRQAA